MANLQPIQFKRSFTPGSVPSASDLLVGELAINFADRTIYSKNDSDIVVEIGSNYDSDIAKLLAGDSDLKSQLDSDILNLKVKDLFDVVIPQGTPAVTKTDVQITGSTDKNGTYVLVNATIGANDSEGVWMIGSSVPSNVTLPSYFDSDNQRAILFASLSSGAGGGFGWKVMDNVSREILTNTFPRPWFTQATPHDPSLTIDLATSDPSQPPVGNFTDASGGSINTVQTIITPAISGINNEDVLVWYSDSEVWKPQPLLQLFRDADSDLKAQVDSDAYIKRLNDVKVLDSELQHNSYLSWDSDEQKWVVSAPDTRISSWLKNQRYTGTSVRNVTEFFLDKEPKGAISLFRNGVRLTDDCHTYRDSDGTLVYNPAANNNENFDSDDELNIIYSYSDGTLGGTRLNQLADVENAVENPGDGQSIRWDSDSRLWRLADTRNASLEIESFTATQAQTSFTLQGAPKGNVIFSRNGVVLDDTATSVSGSIVTYIPAGNSNESLDSNDYIQIQYVGAEAYYGVYSNLSELKDVKFSNPQENDILYLDSEFSVRNKQPESSSKDLRPTIDIITRTESVQIGVDQNFYFQNTADKGPVIVPKAGQRISIEEIEHYNNFTINPFRLVNPNANEQVPLAKTYVDSGTSADLSYNDGAEWEVRVYLFDSNEGWNISVKWDAGSGTGLFKAVRYR